MSDCSVQNYNFPQIHQNNKYSYSAPKKISSSTDTVSFRSNQNKNNQPKKLKDIIKELKNIIIKNYKQTFFSSGMLSKIFRREVSEEEAENILRQYKRIINIENKEEYIKQMFNQIKKDYGWKDIDFTYELEWNKDPSVLGGFQILKIVTRETDDGKTEIEFIPETISLRFDMSKKEIFGIFMHEFQHCKQYELAYRTDKKKYLDAIIKARFSNTKDSFSKEKNAKEIYEYIDKLIQQYKDAINKYYAPVWDKLPPLRKGSKEYELGLKYIDNLANYITSTQDKKAYYKQILEKEAYNTSFLADCIYERALLRK